MIGTRLAHYDITGHLGTGGMGEVYRATDSRLSRGVAIKLLPVEFSSDAERLSRFRREAQVLASLNHPNIAQIYGLEESGKTPCIVMELVEGETLDSKIQRGPIPVDEVLTIAKQIIEALEAAHERGIVHRDLKPGNVMLTRDGKVKVLDFGLAKASEFASSTESLPHSPTIATHYPSAATHAGVILGTAAYMSPEQARGKVVDKRADIWAFGAVLYEMLTGHRAFSGEDATDTLAAVVRADPKWENIGRANVPQRLRQVLRVCLQKDPKQRAQDIGDVRLALEGSFEAGASQEKAANPRPWIAALLFAVILIATLAVPAIRHLNEKIAGEIRTEIVTPPSDSPVGFALSPDGEKIVYVASDATGSRLWVRSLSTTAAQPIAGTEGASLPFWSPDSHSIGFFASGSLKRVDPGGGAPQTLASALAGTGGTWNRDGVILFAPTVTSSLMRVPATGGKPEVLTKLEPQQSAHTLPSFLPDGHRFLFYGRGSPETSGIYLGTLDGSAPKRLTPAEAAGAYLPTGWLLWSRSGTLLAQRLDPGSGTLTGDTVTVADGVIDDGRNAIGVSTTATGLLAYRTGEFSRRQLTWFDRMGAPKGTIGPTDGTLYNLSISPDGKRVVVSRMVQRNNDIWLLDGARLTRVTFDEATDYFPIWLPDSARIVFRSTRAGPGDLYEKLVSGAGADQPIVQSDQLKTPSSVSSDGKFLMYMSQDPQTSSDLWILPMTGNERKPSVFLKTPFREAYGAFSPNGMWVAYQSNESGLAEIYVRPFVPPGTTGSSSGGPWQVSTDGGISPIWSSDGKELYYIDPAGALMSAPVRVTQSLVEPGTPVKLFQTHILGGGIDFQQGRQYAVASDGRILINTVLDSATAPITLIQNWNPGPKR